MNRGEMESYDSTPLFRRGAIWVGDLPGGSLFLVPKTERRDLQAEERPRTKYDTDPATGQLRYWIQVDGEGLLWYPVSWVSRENLGMTDCHRRARNEIVQGYATGIYDGVEWNEIEVEEMTYRERECIRPFDHTYILDLKT